MASVIYKDSTSARLQLVFPRNRCGTEDVTWQLRYFTTDWKTISCSVVNRKAEVVVPIHDQIILQGIILCGTVAEVLDDVYLSPRGRRAPGNDSTR